MPKITSATIAVALAFAALASRIVISRTALPWGFNVFFFWSGLCVAAVHADRLLVWAVMCCSALAFTSIDWWLNGPPPVNEYGFGAIDAIALFSGTAIVIAATCVLAVTRTLTQSRTAVC